MTNPLVPFAAGTEVGPYEIIDWLGAGGMGVVYRARDRRLGRDVAIKMIAESARKETSVERFEREARAAGQLAHPNILTVYDVGTHDGVPYIVSELLEGQSLRATIAERRIGSGEAIEVARQVADGLSALHQKGLVHRDIKPDNLFVTSENRIKILDLGIAKLKEPGDDAGLRAQAQTETQREVAGTMSYMSPEQVRGEPVDGRSDIFSLGVVLHEMLVGAPPSVRETPADTAAAILREPLARHAPRPDISAGVWRILQRCLEKDPDARFQSARDLMFTLSDLRDFNSPVPLWLSLAGHRPSLASIAIGAVVVTASLLAIAAVAWNDNDDSTAARLTDARFTRFTDWNGVEGEGEISPDGRFVAFVADRGGEFGIWVSQVGSGRFTNLTPDTRMLPPEVVMRQFGFSGDGSEIWFNRGNRRELLPVMGGKPRTLPVQQGVALAWSPDNTRLAFTRIENGDALFMADATGANARPIVTARPDVHQHNPAWSPDGQWLYFVRGPSSGASFEMDIWRVRPSGESLEQLTHLKRALNYLAPVDARTVFFTARDADQSGPWLWTLDVPTRKVQRVVSGLEHYTSVAASHDGRRIVATVADPTATLWRVPILDRIADDADVERFAVPNQRALAPRFASRSLFYLSGGTAQDGVWRTENGQAAEIWRGRDGHVVDPPAIAPDGTRLAVTLRRDRKQQLHVMAADGTDARSIGPDIEARGAAGWSPDQRSIAVGGRDARGPALFTIPLAGGDPVRLVEGEAVNPEWSPDGNLLLYNGPNVDGFWPLLALGADGRRVTLPPIRTRPGGHRFLPDGKRVVYRIMGDFWLLDLATNQTRQLTRLKLETSPLARQAFDVAPDGKSIVFDRSSENSDVVLIELPP